MLFEAAVSALNVAKELFVRDLAATASVISAVTAVSASSLGIIPKVGAVRALTLAFHSKIRGSYPTSQRIQDVYALENRLKEMKRGKYIIITGAKRYRKIMCC